LGDGRSDHNSLIPGKMHSNISSSRIWNWIQIFTGGTKKTIDGIITQSTSNGILVMSSNLISFLPSFSGTLTIVLCGCNCSRSCIYTHRSTQNKKIPLLNSNESDSHLHTPCAEEEEEKKKRKKQPISS
jgi:hypothetical protein